MSAAAKIVIYQLLPRYFGNTLAINGCGRFADIDRAAVAALGQMGATHVWLTGCARQATLTAYPELGLAADDPDIVKGIAGSMYAVRDAFDVCPDYATNPAERIAEFKLLIERIHAAGLKVLVDCVPNHVARGYHSINHPEWDFGLGDDSGRFFDPANHFFYLIDPPGQQLRLTRPAYWSPAGFAFDGLYAPEDGGPGRVPKASGDNCTSPAPTKDNWYETVKLNYGSNFADGASDYNPRPRTWDAMDRVLAFWQSLGADGFRCDMAHMVPGEAWQFLIDRAKSRGSGCYFLAEAYPTGDRSYPVRSLEALIDAGFDAVYDCDSYNALKRIYQVCGSQDDYDRVVSSRSASGRATRLEYLENHDERRIASPVVYNASTGDSGFGSAAAGYQLAPLQLLASSGPVIVYNGQEVGEPGAGFNGFSSEDGRSTTFDYWTMPEFAKWVNGHAYDGGQLSAEQESLRAFYADLLALCQDPSVCGSGYWGLKYFNCNGRFADCPDDLYSFARFADASGRLLIVVANFRPSADVQGQLRIPAELAATAGLSANVTVRLVLDRDGRNDAVLANQSATSLATAGFQVNIPDQSANVYAIESQT